MKPPKLISLKRRKKREIYLSDARPGVKKKRRRGEYL